MPINMGLSFNALMGLFDEFIHAYLHIQLTILKSESQ